MTTRKRVVTYYDPPPIPDRRWDWTACLDDYEPHGPVGYGCTEREALIDLQYLMEDD